MTPRPAGALLGAGLAVVVAGSATLAWSTAHYLDNWRAPSSTSGDRVYRDGDRLVAYPPFTLGLEPTFIALGLAIVVAAIAIAALTWRRAQPS
jgi:ABC-type nickel/cobalt efflux system permease component RcnA